MFEMSLQNLVNAIVDQELARKGNDTHGLYFSFDPGLSFYSDSGEDYSAKRRGLHLLYQVNAGYSYINVFSAVTDSPFDPISKCEWKHEHTHDSCWRSVNAISDLYFEMAEEINQQLEADGKPRIAPRDMCQYVHTALSRNLYSWVPCKVEKDPADPHNYRRIVIIGKPTT